MAASGPHWPGAAYVDWSGTDFYSRYANFSGLSRVYNSRLYAGKPFVFGEWAMWGRDDPAFMRRFFNCDLEERGGATDRVRRLSA